MFLEQYAKPFVADINAYGGGMTDDAFELHAAVTTIMRALKIAERDVQVAHREWNFVAADVQTLRFLSAHPGCKLADLAMHLGVVPTTASSVIERLVDRGLVQRERPETNRRAIALTLTDGGRETFGLIDAEEKSTMQVMLDALPQEDRPAFIRSMKQIAKSVENLKAN